MLWKSAKGDERLVRNVLDGRVDDFSLLVKRYLPAMHALGYAWLGNLSDAEDVAQEAFIKAWRSLDKLQEPAKFGPWLLTIARNACAEHRRARTRREARERAAGDSVATPQDPIEAGEMRKVLRYHIEKLDEPSREVILLHYFAGKKVREIAPLVDATPAAVKKRLQRAREALGANMLRDLKPRPDRAEDLKRQQQSIMGLIGGAPVAWQASGAIAATGAVKGGGWFLLMPKWLTAAAVTTVLAGAGLGLHALQDKDTLEEPAGIAATPTPSEASSAAPGDRVGSAPPREDEVVFASERPGQPEAVLGAPGKMATCRVSVVNDKGKPMPGLTVSAYARVWDEETPSHWRKPIAQGETDSDGHAVLEPLAFPKDYLFLSSTEEYALLEYRQVYKSAQELTLVMYKAGSLSGTVQTRESRPVRNAIVGIEASVDVKRHEIKARCDDAGRFLLEYLPQRSIRLVATAPGYPPVRSAPVQAGQTDVVLTVVPGGAVTGRVIDKTTGAAVAGEKVQFFLQTGGGKGIPSTLTQADGTFAIDGLTPGSYTAQVVGEHYVSESMSRRFGVASGATTSNIELPAIRGGVIQGRMWNVETGRAAEFGRAKCTRDDGRYSFTPEKIEEDGTFRIGPLLPGSYELKVSTSGEYSFLTGQPLTEIEVTAGEETDLLEFRLRPGVTVTGVVHAPDGEPKDVQVLYRIKSSSQSMGNSVRTWTDNAFTINRVAPGSTITLLARKGSRVSEIMGPLQVPPSGLEHIVLNLREGASVSGRKLDAEGNPAIAAGNIWNNSVRAELMDGSERKASNRFRSRSAKLEADGSFLIDGLLPGTYRIETETVKLVWGQKYRALVIQPDSAGNTLSGRVVDASGLGIAGAGLRFRAQDDSPGRSPSTISGPDGYWKAHGLGNGAYNLSASCEGFLDAHVRDVHTGEGEVEVVMERLGAVKGRVVDARNGKPITRYAMGYAVGRRTVGTIPIPERRDYASDSGEFSITEIGKLGPDRLITLRAYAPSYQPGHALLELVPGETVSDVVIELQPGPVIEGRVVDGDGSPVPDAAVFVDWSPIVSRPSTATMWADAVTDRTGAFRLDMVQADLSYIEVQAHPRFATKTFPIALRSATEVRQVELILTEGAVVEGHVLKDGVPCADVRVSLEERGKSTTSDAEGWFRIDHVPPGRNTLFCSRGGVNHYEQPIMLVDGTVTPVEIEVPKGTGLIKGTVKYGDRPVRWDEQNRGHPGTAMVWLILTFPDGSVAWHKPEYTGPGNYQFENVPEGEARLKVFYWSVGDIRTNAEATLSMAGQSVTQGFQLDHHGVLTGAASGPFSSEAFVFLLPDGGLLSPEEMADGRFVERNARYKSLIANDGLFRLEHIEPGGYLLVAGTEGAGLQVQQRITIPNTGEARVAFTLE